MHFDPLQVVTGLGFPPAWGYILHRWLRLSFYFQWCCSAVGGMIGSVLPPAAWLQADCNGASLIIAAVLWWLSRRRKRRAPKLAGAKSKALLAAVVAKMRETAKPRPVFRPAPGGSGA